MAIHNISNKKYFFYILLIVGVFVAFLAFMILVRGFMARPLISHFSR